MKNIVILGTGGFAREVLTVIKDINCVSMTYNILGFVENDKPKGTLVNGLPVIGNDNDLLETQEEIYVALAFGDPLLKKRVLQKFESNPLIKFPTLIHSSVIIGDKEFVTIGQGCIICAGCILTTNIHIKDYVTLNLMCTVGHDTNIGNYSSFMPSCNISGEVQIDENVYAGTGVKIINQVAIGKNTIIGAGAVVTKSLPENCTAVGMPAKPIKFHES